MEDQAVSLLPHPLDPFPLASCLSFSVFLCVSSVEITEGRGEGGGGQEPNNTVRKPGPLLIIQCSLHSGGSGPCTMCKLQVETFAHLGQGLPCVYSTVAKLPCDKFCTHASLFRMHTALLCMLFF